MKMRLLSTVASTLVLSTAIGLADSYTQTFPSAGVSYLIANQLDHSGGNSLANLFPLGTLPDGTQIWKWNCSSFVIYIYDSTDPDGVGPGASLWYAADDFTPVNANAIFLNPGEGFFIQPSASVSVTFSGTPNVPVLPASLPCGCGQTNYLSRQTNDLGTYEN